MGRIFTTILCFSVFAFMASALFGGTKLLAQDSKEASSPEESYDKPPSSLDLFAEDNLHSDLTGTFNPILQRVPTEGHGKINFLGEDVLSAETELYLNSPLLAPGVFPYTPDPVTAIISVGLTMAFVSLKETGRVDWEGIKKIMNSTDVYAGIVGSVSAGIGQRGVAQGSQFLFNRFSPAFMQPITSSTMVKLIGNMVNGFTYVFAVSSGYEYFSQIWKVATKHSPEEVRTFSDFMNSGWATQRRVIQNIKTIILFQPDMHKRIKDSVWNHRILTYEFIATNVGLYAGMMLGRYLTERYSPTFIDKSTRPWLSVFVNYLGSIMGGITGGLAVQLTPSSWKIGINTWLLDQKIRDKEDDLLAAQRSLKSAIDDQVFPSYDNANLGSYIMEDGNLESDVNRVIRVRDLLLSLYMQQFFVEGSGRESLDLMNHVLAEVQDYFVDLEEMVNHPEFLTQGLWVDLKKGENPRAHRSVREKYQRHYSLILEAARERMQETTQEYHDLFAVMEQTLQTSGN